MRYADVAELTRQADDAQATVEKALNALAASLGDPAAIERDFGRRFGLAQKILRLDDLGMSRLLKVSRPTIGRWARGDSTPHPLARKAIFAALAKEAKAQAKSLAPREMSLVA